MDGEDIRECYRNLTQWQKGDRRAPHKPLLALYALGCVLRQDVRMILFAEIDRVLKELLAEFGPSHSSQGTHYPFWRMQRDRIWEVTADTALEVRSRGDVRKSDLLRERVCGGFPDEIDRVIRRDPRLVHSIVQDLLATNFPDSLHNDILQAVGIDSQAKGRARRDPEFRERILRAYEYRCAVCGFEVCLRNVPIGLEAAHIKWQQAGGLDSVKTVWPCAPFTTSFLNAGPSLCPRTMKSWYSTVSTVTPVFQSG